MARRVVEDGLTLTEAAETTGVSVWTAGRWVRRYRAEGEAGLVDRSSAPATVHNATPADRAAASAAHRSRDR
jgi:transposase